MDELQRRQRMKRMIYSYPALGLLVLVTFLLGKGALTVLSKERESASRVSELEEKTAALAARKADLEGSVARLQTEEGIVEEIKSKFSVERTGEHVAVIVDERIKASSTPVKEPIWYKKLWGAIIGR